MMIVQFKSIVYDFPIATIFNLLSSVVGTENTYGKEAIVTLRSWQACAGNKGE